VSCGNVAQRRQKSNNHFFPLVIAKNFGKYFEYGKKIENLFEIIMKNTQEKGMFFVEGYLRGKCAGFLNRIKFVLMG